LFVLLAGPLLAAGCGGGEVQTVAITAPPEEIIVEQTVVVEVVAEEPAEVAWAASVPAALPTAKPDDLPEGASPGEPALVSISYRPNRLIIKDAELRLAVENTDRAIDRTTQIVADVGGYIISSRVWYQDWMGESYKYATLTLGIPVDQFETAMRRLRDLALRVVDETAAGQDVTDEYVDLESRLRNLEATRDRIRTFLDQAQDVEEALEVNEELAAVEEEIEQVQGRMNYLFDRAGFSTITVQIDPELPTPTPTPTPTATPTPTPESPWSPGPTIKAAGETTVSITRALIELGIWVVMVVLPLVLPPALVAFAIWRLSKRRQIGAETPSES
jgi:hypothetical protein